MMLRSYFTFDAWRSARRTLSSCLRSMTASANTPAHTSTTPNSCRPVMRWPRKRKHSSAATAPEELQMGDEMESSI